MSKVRESLAKPFAYTTRSGEKREVIPFGWVREQSCKQCNNKVEKEIFINNFGVCPDCGYHFGITPFDRMSRLVDEGSFVEFSTDMTSRNPIGMQGYENKIDQTRSKSGLNDAVLTGRATIEGEPTVLGMMAFQFLGGSMGSVVGEKITRAILRAIKLEMPVILFTASGGARMQEGIFSLLQMAKTSNAVALLNEAKLPFFVVLTHPTTGGVTASFAMLGDIQLAEPGALIGFAGPRVIEGTIKQKLPEGFQSAEFQLQKGYVDQIVPRSEMKETLAFLLKIHNNGKGGA